MYCQKCGKELEDLGQGSGKNGKKYSCNICDAVYETANGADTKAGDLARLVFLEKFSEHRAREGVPVGIS